MLRERVSDDNVTLSWVAQVVVTANSSTLFLLLKGGQQLKIVLRHTDEGVVPTARFRFNSARPEDARILLDIFEHYRRSSDPERIFLQGSRDATFPLRTALYDEFDRRLRVVLEALSNSRNTAARRFEMFQQTQLNVPNGSNELPNLCRRLRNYVKCLDAVIRKLQKGLVLNTERGATFEQLTAIYQYLRVHSSQFQDVNMPDSEEQARYVARLINIVEVKKG